MKKNTLGILSALALVFTLHACTSNSEEDIPKPSGGGGGCDTTNINYTEEVRGIFTKHGCLSCHNANNPSGQVNLDDYHNAVSASGLLLPALRHDPNLAPSKYMPQGSPNPIPQCEIQRIEAWINNGNPE